MDRRAIAVLAIGLSACSLARGRAVPAGALGAEEIVARSVAARGGLDAWRKVETMVWTGRIESARAPVTNLEFVLEQKRPNKSRLEITALGQRSVRVFDGTHGWKVASARGQPEARPFSPLEVRYEAGGHGIDGPLMDLAARGSSVTLAGVEELAGRKAYHLAVHLAKGGQEDVWVDTESWLDVRFDRMAGVRRVSTTYGDYRTVQGLKIPFLISTGGGSGGSADRMRIEAVRLNEPMDDATFGNPASPHPRRRAPPTLAHGVRRPGAAAR